MGTISDTYKVRPPRLALAEYGDGSIKNWKWGIATDDRTLEHGFVRLDDLIIQFDFGSGTTLRGFGERHSGVREIDQSDFNDLLKISRAGAKR